MENQGTCRKPSWSKGENQQQTQLTYGVNTEIWTWATLVGGLCSHHCTTLDWQIDNCLLTGQSWHVLKSWYTGGGPEKGFWRCFTDGLNQSLITSAVQASSKLSWSITELDVFGSFTCYYRHEVSHCCVFLLCGNVSYLHCIPNHVVIKRFCN